MTAWTKIELKGLKTTLKKIDMFEMKTQLKISQGLTLAGELVKRESLKMTPVDTGVLKKAAYGGRGVPVLRSREGLYTEVGYSSAIAPYATEVHEAEGKHMGKATPRISKGGRGGNGNMWDIGGRRKFLQNALFKNRGKVIKIINRMVKSVKL